MRIFSALRRPAIARLWMGQALSAVGDEIYRTGLTWLAVGIVGADAGYLGASQAAALMILSLFAGHWADHWAPLKTMIRTDLLRAAIVLVPVVLSYFAQPTMTVIYLVAIPLAAAGAFFDPALQSLLPRYTGSIESIKAANGLMSTTLRLARMLGPMIVGLLAGVIPMIHFFTLDSLSFIASALFVYSIRNMPIETTSHRDASPLVTSPTKQPGSNFITTMRETFAMVRKKGGLGYVFFAKAVTGGSWNLVFLSLAVLIRDMTKEQVEALDTSGSTQTYGLVIACYGFGNFFGALLFGSMRRRRSYLAMYGGYAIFSLGFIAMALAPSIHLIMLSCIFAGFWGPISELGLVDLLQKSFPVHQIARVFRFRITVETASTLLLMILSPYLINTFSPRRVMLACGIAWLLAAAGGYFPTRRADGLDS
jgi:MFS family permease